MTEDFSVLERLAPPPDQTIAFGDEPDQCADIWIGTSGAERPLLLLVHGGFWRPQYGRDQLAPMAAALAEAGWTVATIGYRRNPGEPDVSIGDVCLAVQTLGQRTSTHNDKLVVVGHSAGGHLALLAGLSETCAISGVVALAPVADLRLAEQMDLGNGAVRDFLGGDASSRPDMDPVRRPQVTTPIHLLQGEADQFVPVEIAASFKNSHPETHLTLLPDVGHFALIDPLSKAWSDVKECLLAF